MVQNIHNSKEKSIDTVCEENHTVPCLNEEDGLKEQQEIKQDRENVPRPALDLSSNGRDCMNLGRKAAKQVIF